MDARPEDRGLEPFGGPSHLRPGLLEATSVREATRGPLFWLTLGMLIFGIWGSNSIGLHAYPSVLDKGMDPQEGALVISLLATFSLLGKLAFGWLGDRFPVMLLFMGSLAFQASGYLLLAYAPAGIGVYLFAIIMGTSFGGTTSIQMAVVSEIFGVSAYGAIFGALSTPASLASSSSPVIAGAIRDLTGSYELAWVGFAASNVVAAAIAFTAYRVARRAKR
jgi:MFS family permease